MGEHPATTPPDAVAEPGVPPARMPPASPAGADPGRFVDRSFLRWPFFEPHHARLAEELDAWAADHIAPLAHAPVGDDASLDALCTEMRRRLGAAGWLAHAVPRAHGGVAERLDVRSLCLVRETLARHSGLADFVFALQGLGAGAVSLFGDAALGAHVLPRVARGDMAAAFALSEADAGSDVAAMTTRAEPDGDGGYRLTGTKTWISNAGLADVYTVFARTGEAPGARGISAFLVDADAPGVTVTERIPLIAPHPLGTVAFDRVPVPASRRIGAPGQGFKVAMATLDVFRATVGAAALGLARRALAEAAARARSRRLFGAPMADLQMIQAKIAQMALAVDAAALLVYRAGWTHDVPAHRVTREAAMAKLFATDEAQKVIDEAVQIFGGLGVRAGHPVETLYREIRALRIYEGASEVQKLVIARQTLG